MRQKVVRSYQDGRVGAEDIVNRYLAEGWQIIHSNTLPADCHRNGFVEYVLEYRLPFDYVSRQIQDTMYQQLRPLNEEEKCE